MPELNILDTMLELRKLENSLHLNKSLIIVALIANAVVEELDNYVKMGF